jgi:hypothetical protein
MLVGSSKHRTILACGSREWRDAGVIRLALMMEPRQHGWPEAQPITVVHGGARGADEIAGDQALDLGYYIRVFPAKWDEHGKRAGILRNLEMLDEKPDLVLAFGVGRGTDHTCSEALKRGIEVVRYGDTPGAREALQRRLAS